MVDLIKPSELSPAASVDDDAAMVVDNGGLVLRATPEQVVDAGAPVPTQAQAIAGTDNVMRMTPLTVKQVIDNAAIPAVTRAQAWAESPTAPDPLLPDSKSSKTWAGEAAVSAASAEAAAADAVNNAPFMVKDAATYFDGSDRVDGARYAAKDFSGAWDYSGGVSTPVVLGADRSYSIVSLQEDPSGVDMTPILNDILSSATSGRQVSITGGPGDVVRIDGRLHISAYSRLDLGSISVGGRIVLGTSGRVTQDGRSNFRAMILASGVRSDPAFAIDSRFNSFAPGTGQADTFFDIGLLGNRSLGSKGVHLYAASNYGLSWVDGRADVREFDDGVHLEARTGAYINENDLRLRVYGARRFYLDEINDGNEIARNRISIIAQPDSSGRASQAVKSDSSSTDWNVVVWDWLGGNLDPSTNLHPMELTDKSGFCTGRLSASTTGAYYTPPLLDKSTLLRRNSIDVYASRVHFDAQTFRGVPFRNSAGDDNNIFAGATARYPVTFAGDPVSAGTERYIFSSRFGPTSWPNLSSASITVDLGRVMSDLIGTELQFNSMTALPDTVTVSLSSDNVSWTDILYSGGKGLGNIFSRHDSSGLGSGRYVRLTITGPGSRTVSVASWSLHAAEFSGAEELTQGKYMLGTRGASWGPINSISKAGNSFDTGTPGYQVNGLSVITSTGGPRPTADNLSSVGAASLRFTEVFAVNDTINTSDENEKQQIGDIPDAWLDAWSNVKWQRFKFNHAVDIKGEDARWHTGLIAQQIEAAFAAEGLNAFEIGLLCYDEWSDDFDEDGRQTQFAGSRYGVRYSEAQAMESAWVRRKIINIETK